MSVNSAQLLRLLEPAVRPVDPSGGGGEAGGAGKPQGAFEDQGFDALLSRANERANGVEHADLIEQDDAPAARSTPPDPLATLHTIENASLRGLMAQRGEDSAINPTTNPTRTG